MKSPCVLALDGHDAAGKTTIAKSLASALGAAYVRPFAGARGVELLASAERGDVERTMAIGLEAAAQVVHDHRDKSVVICDRLWLTVFTLVPEAMQARWPERAPTALCWADLPTTLARLSLRKEEEPYPEEWHAKYLRSYRSIGERTGCYFLRTDQNDVAACERLLVAWSKQHLSRDFVRSAR